MKQLFIVLFIYGFWPALSGPLSLAAPPSPNCKPLDYVMARGYEPQEAFQFGEDIKRLVRDKDLKGLYTHVVGELHYGPRRKFITSSTFETVFSEDWRSRVINSSSPCSRLGWRGFMLGNGKIWYEKTEGAWRILSITGANGIDFDIPNLPESWQSSGKVIPPQCFSTERADNSNYRLFEKTFSIMETDNFRRNPGQYFGNEIDRLDPVPSQNRKEAMVISLNQCFVGKIQDGQIVNERDLKLDVIKQDVVSEDCMPNGRCLPIRYKIVDHVSPAECQKLAPSMPGMCEEAYLLTITRKTGGSIGSFLHTAIYGLFTLANTEKFLVPLKNFPNRNVGRNYTDSLK